MKIAGIERDEGNWPECGRHGVSREEIEHALFNMRYRARDPYDREERYRVVSSTADGKSVFVVVTPREHDGEVFYRPISARYMHAKEVKSYGQAEETMADSEDRRRS